MRARAWYSCSRRCATTSSCRGPTAPSRSAPPLCGRNTWIAPSSPSCCNPVRSCLLRIGSATSTVTKISGAKNGSPVNCSLSPSVSVSPSCRRPRFGRPTMSPGYASSSTSRRCERKDTALAVFTSLPVRERTSFMPRSKRPEHTRTKATRSRCAGSMFAWILNTTPVNFGSVGSITRCTASFGPCAGARSTSASSTSCTPKLLIAEPKKTGVWPPSRNDSRSNAWEAPCSSSISPFAWTNASPKRASFPGLARPATISSSSTRRSSPGRKTRMRSARMSKTPPKRLPMPTGQVKGTVGIRSTRSISSRRASGSRVSRSILLMKVMIGVSRARQTSSRRMVCASTPFTPSITMSAASTAVSTRYVSSEKSWCPGVSRRLMTSPRNSICITELATEMPRCFSISIQSEVAWRVALRAFTLPAMWIAPAKSSSFSVSVVLPASGCEMIAKVRRRATSAARSEVEFMRNFSSPCRRSKNQAKRQRLLDSPDGVHPFHLAAHQDLRLRTAGAQGRRPRDREGRDLRPPRPQRRGKDDPHQHRVRHRERVLGHGARGRARQPLGLPRRAREDRARAAGAAHGHVRDGGRDGALQPRALRLPREPGAPGKGAARPLVVGQACQQDHDALRRNEAAGADREGARPRAAGPLPRRAHGGRGRGAAPRHVGARAAAARERRHDHPHHALHRGGRGHGRSHRRDPQGRAHRRRGEGDAHGEARQEAAAAAPRGAARRDPGGARGMAARAPQRRHGSRIHVRLAPGAHGRAHAASPAGRARHRVQGPADQPELARGHLREPGARARPRASPRGEGDLDMNTHAISAIYRFEMSRFGRTLWQSLVTPVITTSLYFIVFGAAIGRRMSEVDGVPYGAFIVPGLVMLSIFTESLNNASIGIYLPKFTGTIYEVLSAPVSALEVVLAYVGAATTKSIVLAAVIL